MNLEIGEKEQDLLVAGLQHLVEASEDALNRTVGRGFANAKDRYDMARERDKAAELIGLITGQSVMDFD